jgi:hypothetical protein
VKLFRRWFIIYDCIKFRLILSKSPRDAGLQPGSPVWFYDPYPM